ncbi:hypothetical protein [Actinoplanes rectilineatus]|uniref:hypothetical protein n=1 Tax=Actinoplanes rectilineatus TaxID=113571 RepID=UPI0005F298BE|nr:hypothetical protein [Actinoplanes rectilineatus]
MALALSAGAVLGLSPAPAQAAANDFTVSVTGTEYVAWDGFGDYQIRVETAPNRTDTADIRAALYLPSGVSILPRERTVDDSGPCGDQGHCTVDKAEDIARGVFTWTVRLQMDSGAHRMRMPIDARVWMVDAPFDAVISDQFDIQVGFPNDLELTATTPSAAQPGRPVVVDVTAQNTGVKPVTKASIRIGGMAEWYTGLELSVKGSRCAPLDKNERVTCTVPLAVEPGKSVSFQARFLTEENDDTWGEFGSILFESVDDLSDGGTAVFFRFAAKGDTPPATTSPSPSSSSGGDGGNGDGDEGGQGGGLPVTGSATGPLIGGGVALLLAGAGALALTRRRRITLRS